MDGISYIEKFIPFFGVHSSLVSQIVDVTGVFLAGGITVVIAICIVISYVKGTISEPFMNSYEDDAFIRGKVGSLLGLITFAGAVWFLFAIVYIYFLFQ